MGNVVTFDTSEQSAIDTDPIQKLKRELGEKRCRSVIDGMIFEITDILCKIEKQMLNGDLRELEVELDKVASVSGDLGLVCLTDVVADLKDCLAANDHVAFSAVSCRLIRLGEDSLFSLIEFTNKSII